MAAETEEQYQARLAAWQAKKQAGEVFPGPMPRRGDQEPIGQGMQTEELGATAPGARLDTQQPDADRERMAGLLGQLQGQAATGAGAWEQALASATDKSRAGAQALGLADRGADNMTMGMNIGNAQASATQRAVGQGNMLRAQSQQDAASQMAGILGGQGALDAQQAATAQAAKQGQIETDLFLHQAALKKDIALASGAGQGFLSGANALNKSDGGPVPGKARTFGDDEANDTVPAMLSPGEIVIPRSIAQRPDAASAAADFVAAVKSRSAAPKSHFDDGGKVEDDVSAAFRAGRSDLASPASVSPVETMDSAPIEAGPYNQTRDAVMLNANRFMDASRGNGPSVAPQQAQNAEDAAISEGMRAMASRRGGMGPSVVSGATERAQEGAGDAAATAATEASKGSQQFAQAVQRQRAQDLSLAQAQQEAAWRNSMMNAGIGLEQQAMMRNLLGSAGQAAAGVSGLFTKGPEKNSYGYDPGTSRYDTAPAYEPPAQQYAPSSPDEWANPYAEGGVVSHLARRGRPSPRPRDSRSPIEKWSDSPAFQDFVGVETKSEKPTMTKAERAAEKAKGREFDAANPDLKDLEVSMADGGGVPDTSQLPAPMGAGTGVLQRFMAYMASPVEAPVLPGVVAGPTPEQLAERARSPRLPTGEAAAPPMPRGVPAIKPPPAVIAPHEPIREAPVAPAPRVAPAPVRPSGKLADAPERPPTPDELAMRAGEEKAAAESGQADATAQALTGLAQGIEASAIQQKERQAQAAMSSERMLAGIQRAREEMKAVDTEVDEGKWWGSRSVPGKIAAIIGLVLGAIGNDNGVNRAAMLIQKQIDQSIDAQKASHELALRKGQAGVASAENLYTLHRQMTQDDIAADAAARGSLFELAKNKVDLAAARAGSPKAKADLAALSASLAAKKVEKDDSTKQRNFDNFIKAGNLKVAQTEAAAKVTAAGLKEEGKVLPAETASGLAELPVAMRQLDALGKTFTDKASGKLAKASAMLPDFVGRGLGTDVADYNAQALQAMQAVGKIMEGGKLAAGDEDKYKRMLPRAGEDADLAALKLAGAKAFLSDLVESRKKFLSESGYKVPGMNVGATPDPNAAARAWLAANPNDPRAAAIRAKIGAR